MTCIRLKKGKGFVCVPNAFVSLEPFGSKVWCEMHSYFGPTFYRSENAITPIYRPSRKTWNAYYEWQMSIETNKSDPPTKPAP